MRTCRCVLAGALVVMAFCGHSQADVFFIYDLDEPDYQLEPGQSVDVPIYLAEMAAEAGDSLLAGEGGLFSAGLLVQRTGTTLGAPSRLTGLAANTDEFDDHPPTITLADDEAALFEMVLLSETRTTGAGAEETSEGSGVRRILLGVLTVTAGAAKGEVTTYQVTTNTTDDTRTWLSFSLLDADIDSTSFTITVIPEPVTLGLLWLGGLALLRRRRTWPRAAGHLAVVLPVAAQPIVRPIFWRLNGDLSPVGLILQRYERSRKPMLPADGTFQEPDSWKETGHGRRHDSED